MRSNSSAKAHMRCPSSSKSSTSSRGFVLCVPRRSSRVTLSRWMKRGAPSGGALDFGIRRWSQPCESMRTRVRNASISPPFGFQTSHEHAIIPGAAPHSIAVEFIVWNPRGHLIHTYLVRCERTDASFHQLATHIGSATLSLGPCEQAVTQNTVSYKDYGIHGRHSGKATAAGTITYYTITPKLA